MLRPICETSDPFNCECRAFGRLQEANREERAIKRFSYLLLSEGEREGGVEIKYETFVYSLNDYLQLGEAVRILYIEIGERKKPRKLRFVLCDGRSYTKRYNLRIQKARETVFIFVDPREYS
ncbi:hypothetical protein GGS26DRAFT_554321 [Hypomontagnella submonticulosa]|nr:hypothetical protein GGS26DRAFT_554321 [Hypomontagnella submonticulosa]